MRDKIVICCECGEPFIVSADDRRAREEATHTLCDDCGQELALQICRTYKE